MPFLFDPKLILQEKIVDYNSSLLHHAARCCSCDQTKHVKWSKLIPSLILENNDGVRPQGLAKKKKATTKMLKAHVL